jgi:hypothetical protein
MISRYCLRVRRVSTWHPCIVFISVKKRVADNDVDRTRQAHSMPPGAGQGTADTEDQRDYMKNLSRSKYQISVSCVYSKRYPQQFSSATCFEPTCLC